MTYSHFSITDNIKRDKRHIAYCPTDNILGDYFTKPQQGSKMRRSRVRIMNLPNDPTLFSQECVETGKNMKPGDNGHILPASHNNNESVFNIYNYTTVCEENNNSHKSSGTNDAFINDVLRRKVGSYLMAAKKLLGKVRGGSHFAQLT